MSGVTIKLIEKNRLIAVSLDGVGSYLEATGAEIMPELLRHCQSMVQQSLDFATRTNAVRPWTGYLVCAKQRK